MPRIVIEIEWDTPEDPHWLNADNVALALHAHCKNTKFKVHSRPLSASEALFGFAGWLTTRTERTVMSSKDDAAVAADLVGEFCEANQLAEPRGKWAESLVHPAS